MNDEQLNKLFAAARLVKQDTARTEFGFETRLVARLRADQPVTPWTTWLWRLVPAFAAVVIALGVWNYVELLSDDVELNAEQILYSHLEGL